ncbi:pyridoxal phosphate-dependent aminotransferase [Acidocella sp.]|uniref:pyridoxal phosphate-dependent aminotransferase n=1 Tax=Acidocella sp. TaxID=50710 RepID=UPI0026303DF1|nr:aminotransferase class I/II-fold pyridoxal phosphate-dependent enzyme [Acidocella sp.]
MLKTGIGGDVPAFRVMDVITRANERAASLPPGAPGVIRLESGQPSIGLPEGAKAAVQAALMSGDPLGYTETLGRPSLRAAIAAHIRAWYGADVAPSRIMVTVGGSGAFPLAFLAAFTTGDEVALASPYYPPYLNILVALGLKPVILPCGLETGFQPTIEMLEALPRKPEGLIIANPANPTGSMMSRAEVERLALWCHANGVRLISDEIYHGLTYGKPICTASALSPSAIVINSFSKYFAMTGWRIGWMVLPEALVRPAERLAQNFFISAPYISQVAAEAALSCHAELEARRQTYESARAVMLDGLHAAGFSRISPPDGAFYAYAELPAAAPDAMAYCAWLLAEKNIAATPGLDFDAARGQRFVRFSYCLAPDMIAEAMARLAPGA